MTDTRTTLITDENSYSEALETARGMNGGAVTVIGVVDALNPDGTYQYESGHMADFIATMDARRNNARGGGRRPPDSDDDEN